MKLPSLATTTALALLAAVPTLPAALTGDGDDTLPAGAIGTGLAAGQPKFLGGVHSTAQITNFIDYWNQVTPENAGKWGSVEATRDVMTWTQLDAAYDFAKANGLPFRFHVLLWGNQQPAWIATLPANEQLEEIEEWFAAVAARYPDIDYVEVVNEPIRDAPDGLPGNFDAPGSVDPNDGNYMNALGGSGDSGWDWVINAFRLAREAFPNASLVLNEYSIVNDPTTLNRYIGIINLLKAEGLVDIVSEQAHGFTVNTMQAATLTANLNTLAATGLPIMITEMDIDGADATTANDATQLDRYQRLFPALWEHPAIMGITTWGYRPGMWRPNGVLALTDGTERSALAWLRTYVEASNPPLRPTFMRSPRSVARNAGQGATFAAVVSGNPEPTLQWQRSANGTDWTNLANDSTFSGVTTDTLTIAATSAAINGHRFRLLGTNASAPSGLSTYAATLTVNDTPVISVQPTATTSTAGGQTKLTVTAGGTGLTYQWRLDGVDIAGATGAEYTIPSTQVFHGGSYTVVVTNANGSATSEAAVVTVNPAPDSNARLMNLSTRALDLTGGNALIPGFVISGTGTKRMLIRAVGPGMYDTFELEDRLVDSQLFLRDESNPGEILASNDDWGTASNKADIIATSQEVGAFPLAEGSKDAAMLVDLPPGRYTAIAPGVGDATGIAMVELYDADDAPTATLINISNRGFVDVGHRIMIPGFVVSPEGSRTFLIRAVGPGLATTFPEIIAADTVLQDPVLTVFRGANPILTVDDWSAGSQATTTQAVATQVGAFPLVEGSKDAAFVVTLAPGHYTIQATGKNASTGVALVEVYLVPNTK